MGIEPICGNFSNRDHGQFGGFFVKINPALDPGQRFAQPPRQGQPELAPFVLVVVLVLVLNLVASCKVLCASVFRFFGSKTLGFDGISWELMVVGPYGGRTPVPRPRTPLSLIHISEPTR